MEYEYQSHLKKQLQQQQPPSVPERRRVVKKPGTIHDAAQSGDLVALQVKLQENGSLINLRNPIVRVLHSQDANCFSDVGSYLALTHMYMLGFVDSQQTSGSTLYFMGYSKLPLSNKCLHPLSGMRSYYKS